MGLESFTSAGLQWSTAETARLSIRRICHRPDAMLCASNAT